jgi:2-C-methyl-D-erythritol 4-phosphate cytidylyltransferase
VLQRLRAKRSPAALLQSAGPIDDNAMPRLIALIPAAGGGARIGAPVPKQYLPLAGRTLLHHAVSCLAGHARIEQIYVVLAPADGGFKAQDWSAFGERLVPLYCGGETRAASVRNGLIAINDAVAADDWILVHDAARPCLPRTSLDRLIAQVQGDATGGLLAVPVADTLKRADADQRVAATQPRAGLWQAQTPQMFRYRLLLEGLACMPLAEVTDEASAVERLGAKPRLVQGDPRNLKVTYPEDLRIAELIIADALGRQEAAEDCA